MNPAVAVGIIEYGDAFKQLVTVQEKYHPENRQLPPEGGSKAKGHNNSPCGNEVQMHIESGLSAAPDDSGGDGASGRPCR